MCVLNVVSIADFVVDVDFYCEKDHRKSSVFVSYFDVGVVLRRFQSAAAELVKLFFSLLVHFQIVLLRHYAACCHNDNKQPVVRRRNHERGLCSDHPRTAEAGTNC